MLICKRLWWKRKVYLLYRGPVTEHKVITQPLGQVLRYDFRFHHKAIMPVAGINFYQRGLWYMPG